MSLYHFTLILEKPSVQSCAIEDRIFESGCDDALLCFFDDTPYLEFERTGKSLSEARESALRDIAAAGFKVSRTFPEGWPFHDSCLPCPLVNIDLGLTHANIGTNNTGKS